jgi:hypothetical protein
MFRPLDDKEVARLRKLTVGQRANEFVAHLLSARFLGYWTFFEPKHRGIELADALVWWGDTAILFEVKAREVTGGDDSKWVKQRLRDAIGQLNSRAALLRQGKVGKLRNRWRGSAPWVPANITTYIGVVILAHDSDPYNPEDIAGDLLSSTSLPIHVMSIYDITNLLRFVNTIPDLIVYLEVRHAIMRQMTVPVHGESDVYREILTCWPEFRGPRTPLESALKTQEFLVLLFNAAIRHSEATAEGYSAIAHGLLIDYALGSLIHLADADASGKRIGAPEHHTLVQALETLSELSRHRRCYYGNIWLAAAREAIRIGDAIHSSCSSKQRLRSYVLAATPGASPPRMQLAKLAASAMAAQESSSAIAIGASAERIVAAYDLFLAWARGDRGIEADDTHVLDTNVAYVDMEKSG